MQATDFAADYVNKLNCAALTKEGPPLRARDIMTTDCSTVRVDCPIADVARRLLHRGVSSMPVVDPLGRLVGIVTESDLINAAPMAAGRESSEFLAASVRGATARDVMNSRVATIEESTLLSDIIESLDRYELRSIPVTRDGILVGIVSRADILRAMAHCNDERAARRADRQLRAEILSRLEQASDVRPDFINFTVTDGIVNFWGSAPTGTEIEIARRAMAGSRDMYG